MSTKLAILLWATDPDQPQRCATPFFHAATAAAMDAEVEMFFTSASVKLLVPGVAASIFSAEERTQSVFEFMRLAAQHGVRFYACSQALQAYGLAQEALVPECTGVGGAATFMARVMDEAWQTLTY
jgi:predicted peroxiredoxin